MKVAIIILHFGQKAVTQRCVKSLYQHEAHPLSLIVVNNMVEPLSKKDFPQKTITIINNHANLGFAGGVNVGIREALYQKADAMLLLNNDTIITRPFLSQLVKSLQANKKAGIVAPVIEYKKNGHTTYDMGGHVMMPFGKTYHIEVASLVGNSQRDIDYVSGCCMLIKSKVLEEVGLFDDHFFLYYEDVDFCLRAKKRGFEIEVNPEVTIYHELSKSAGKLSSLAIHHQLRSALLFGKKYSRNGLERLFHIAFVAMQTFLFFKASPTNTMKALSAWRALL